MFARLVTVAPRMKSLVAAVITLTTLLAASPRVSAGSVTLDFDQTTGTSPVSIKYTIGGKTTSETVVPGPYYWHQVGSPLNTSIPNSISTFCVELNQYVSIGQQYTFTTTPLASQAGLTSTEVTDITKLYAADYNSAWNSSSFTGSIQSSAFQLALWKLIVDDGTNLDLTAGNFSVVGATISSLSNTSTAAGLAQSYLNSLAGTSSSLFSTKYSGDQLVWLSNGSSQDQLTIVPYTTPPVVTPAPPGLLLAGIGFLGLLGRSFRRRQDAAPTVS